MNGASDRAKIYRFKTIYEEYHEKLYAYILSKSSSTYLAEEVVQITFIKFWENKYFEDDEIPVNIKLFRIARTTFIDLLRKDSKRNLQLNTIAETFPQIYEDELYQNQDTLHHINKAIDAMPPMRKAIFNLSRVNGLSYKEIAGVFGISEKTVEHHIYLALKELKKVIGFLAILQILKF